MYVGRKSLSQLTTDDVEKIVDEVVREKIKEAITIHGDLKNAVAAKIWMNKEKGIEIKKVRCFFKQVKPIEIKQHRDISKHEYKIFVRAMKLSFNIELLPSKKNVVYIYNDDNEFIIVDDKFLYLIIRTMY